MPWGFITGLVIVLCFVGFLAGPMSRRRETEAPSDFFAGSESIDVSRVQLALDWRARREVQAKLEELAAGGATSTPEGLASLLYETVRALRQARLAWLYAHVDNMPPTSMQGAEQRFRFLAADARAGFVEELIRNADGEVHQRDASPMRARPEEGEGVVVVSVVVAARVLELHDVNDPTDVEALDRLLRELEQVGQFGALVALEVVWSPAADEDRMSTAELEQNYPALQKIDENAIGGRRFCDYCRGPFAEELGDCPHCGAPVATA